DLSGAYGLDAGHNWSSRRAPVLYPTSTPDYRAAWTIQRSYSPRRAVDRFVGVGDLEIGVARAVDVALLIACEALVQPAGLVLAQVVSSPAGGGATRV
ncbi:MAG: hypothetical protein ABIQ09_09740, partial [Jatrophihabitantaceae bacterium]